MEYKALTALTIFAVTLFLMVKRPRNINLGLAAGIGAAASLLLGTVTINETLKAFTEIWDAALAFIGIVAFSVTLDAMGFFKWAAVRVVKLAGGNGLKLYFYVSLLTACVSILFANDSAVLILTPIVLEIISQLKIKYEGRLAYLFAAGLIADTAAMPLITSNPINIVSADFFRYSFTDHVIFMGPVAVVTILSSLLIVYMFFRKMIPRTYSAQLAGALANGRIIDPFLLKVSLTTLVAIDVGYVLASLHRIPVSIVICSGALILMVAYALNLKMKGRMALKDERRGITAIIKEINWDIVIFMISIFLVVQGLKHTGAVDFFAYTFAWALKLPSFLSVLVPSLVVTVGASAMNNWPMTILGILSIEQTARFANLNSQQLTSLIFSNIIGNNLGPHFFPLGSLAILMWLETMRKKGVNIRLVDYLKVGSLLSILEVSVASLILWLEISFLNINLSIHL
ncbi:MAG: ArsB/NhaD family transporter [Candidatus Bathyarchaeia archaeon]